jgi:magnesium chelatase family protein
VLDIQALQAACNLGAAEHCLLAQAAARLGLSARGCHRAMRAARTIADLDGADTVTTTHLSEALGYRTLDRLSAEAMPG